MNLEQIVFSKQLYGAPLEESAVKLAAAGFSGFEVTVRTGENIEPERVADELPALAGKLKNTGMNIAMITTQINSPDAPFAEKILRTAASLGIRQYRLGEWRYEGFGTLRRQRDTVKAQLRDIAAMNRAVGIQGVFQNHSHKFFGAVPADLDYALGDLPPADIGVYYDPVHGVIEGGSSGWLMGLDILADRIAALGVKDFYWLNDKSGYAGARLHSMRLTKLGTGNVPWEDIVQILRRIQFDGPCSFYGSGRAKNGQGAAMSLDEQIQMLAGERRIFIELCNVDTE